MQVAGVDFHYVRIGKIFSAEKGGMEREDASHPEGEDAEGFSLCENGGAGNV